MKNTRNAGVDYFGFCFYKSTNGIKRHLAVDTLGFPFFTHCTRASVSDEVGLIDISTTLNVNPERSRRVEMLSYNIDYFKSKPANIPKITVLLDHGYHPERLMEELKKIYPDIETKIHRTYARVIAIAGHLSC